LWIELDLSRIDSQEKYGALAQADCPMYLGFARKGYHERIWDHAVGYIVVKGMHKQTLFCSL